MVNENSLFGYINQESVSQVMEITGTFKCRAKTMVDVAIQVRQSYVFVFLAVNIE
jgi:hypothetical protein